MSNKSLKVLNLLYFLALLFLGIYFGKQRAIFGDSSMQLYDMANTGFPRVNPSMYATVVNFILPYFAIVAGLSVKVMVYAQALNYLLLPLITFVFLRYRQGTVKYELSFLLTFTIFNWHTFYFPIHDYWTGFYYLFILYRIADDKSLKWTPFQVRVAEYLLIALMMFTHLSIVISIGFLYIWMYLERSRNFRQVSVVYSFILLVLIFKILFVNSGYQNTLINPKEMAAGKLFSTDTMKEFWPTLFRSNINFLVLFLVAAAFAVKEKIYKGAFLLFVVFIMSVTVINVLFGSYGYTVYTEGYFKSLNIVSGIVITGILLETLRIKNPVIALIAANYLFSIFILWNGSIIFQKQYTFIKESCSRFSTNVYLRSQKNICPLECLTTSRLSILINQMENNRKTCIFANIRAQESVEKLNQKWIYDNSISPVHNFTFPNEMIYLNADSMHFPVDSFSVLFFKRDCDDMVKRLFPKGG